jgi:hypothetical protein
MTATGQPDPDLPATLDMASAGLRGVALLVRFALELALLAGAAWGAWTASGDHWWRWVFVWLAPLAVATVWGTWLSPRAPRKPAEPVCVLLEAALFGGVAALLWWQGHPWPAVALAGAWALDRAVLATASRPRSR